MAKQMYSAEYVPALRLTTLRSDALACAALSFAVVDGTGSEGLVNPARELDATIEADLKKRESGVALEALLIDVLMALIDENSGVKVKTAYNGLPRCSPEIPAHNLFSGFGFEMRQTGGDHRRIGNSIDPSSALSARSA